MVKRYVEHSLLVMNTDKEVHTSIPEYVPSDCIGEFQSGTLRPTEKGLAVIDTIIPDILNPLNES
jgi:hypothetical protein